MFQSQNETVGCEIQGSVLKIPIDLVDTGSVNSTTQAAQTAPTRNLPRCGHVLTLTEETYGILKYQGGTEILVYTPEEGETSCEQVVATLTRRTGGRFQVADRDSAAWGRVLARSRVVREYTDHGWEVR